jgi:molecular chaperone GrpE
MSNDTPNSRGPHETAPPAPPANDAGPGSPAPDASPGEVDPRVIELEAEVAKLKDQVLRALAEAENTRRRTQRELEENSKYAVSNLARDMLPMADNLRRALDGIPAEVRAGDEKLNQFAAGIELVERELLATLERYQIKRVDPLGQPFDHNLHQAVMQVEAADKPAGTVVQVLQSGFTIHGRLLRPAMVVVAKGGASNTAATVDTTA